MYETILQELYYNPESAACYAGVQALHREAKKKNRKIKRKDVVEFLSAQDPYTIHRTKRRRFKRNKVVPSGLDTDWQSDLMDMQNLAKHNNGYKYIITVIDCLSRYKWARALKNKTPSEVIRAFTEIFETTDRRPWRIYTDNGKEYCNSSFREFLKTHDIRHVTTRSPDIKAGMAENFNKTLKLRLYKLFTHKGSYKWVDVYLKIVNSLNKSVNRITGQKPTDINHKNAPKLWKKLYKNFKETQPYKFEVNDKVRIAEHRHTFTRGYDPTFTEEIFTIYERIPKNPPIYRIKDYNGEKIEGNYYEKEMVKVLKADDTYKIEKILQYKTIKSKKYALVKWFGYPETFNSWEPADEIVSIE